VKKFGGGGATGAAQGSNLLFSVFLVLSF